MRVWLVTIGEPLPTDGDGGDRLYRAGILATLLAQRGHEVVWWSSTFDHVRKRQRFSTDTTLRLDSGVLLKLLQGCGYRRNVSLRRLVDHAILARKFSAQARNMPCPDVVLCSLPPLELSAAVTRYGKAHDVPVIVDVRDLWPDIFLELVPSWARSLFGFALTPMWRQARAACQNAFAITGNCPEFVEWGLRHARRPAGNLDRFFPFGYLVPVLTDKVREKARHFWNTYGLCEGDTQFTICFFGAFSNQFDLETVIDAALMLEAEGVSARFVLCGAGEHLEALRARASGSRAVIFPGWVGRAEIWTLMTLCDVGIAPYRNHVGFAGNLPNKPIEYMAGGLPIVSGLRGYLAEFLDRHQCGLTYVPGDAQALRDVVVRLMKDTELLTKMSANARRVFSEKLDAGKVYGQMIDYLQNAAAVHSSSHSALSA